jgi:cysteine synthase
MIFCDLSKTVGSTPMVELERLAKGLAGRVVGKLEMRNPCGSVKDRVGHRMAISPRGSRATVSSTPH